MEHISPTALETFLKCPQKYAYQYEHQLRPHRPTVAALQGQLFHLAMDHFSKACIDKSSTFENEMNHAAISSFLNGSTVKKKCIEAGHDPLEVTEAVSLLLKYQLSVENIWFSEVNAQPAASEQKQTQPFMNLSPEFEMYIDRIDHSPDGFWLIDYKTQATPPSWTALHKFELIQPWIYSWFGKKHYGDDFLGFVYFLPKTGTIRPILVAQERALEKIKPWITQKKKLITPDILNEKFDLLRDHLEITLNNMKQKNFFMNAPPMNQCRVCSYRIICEVIKT
jgi:ATP-dependent helicase/DNAse subunit B